MDIPRELRLISDRTDDRQDAAIIARAAAMIEGQLALIERLQSDTRPDACAGLSAAECG